MELAQLDEILRTHTAAESRIAQNLVDLEARPTLGILRTTTWSGRSGGVLAPAIAAAARLWPSFQAYRDVLAAARQRRGAGRRLEAVDRQSLEVLLTGPSVLVDSSLLAPEERTLLGSDVRERWSSLDEMVATMSADYDAVTDAVGSVERAWNDTVPALDRARVAAGASGLATDDPALATLAQQVASVEATLASDPLAVDAEVLAALDAAVSIVQERRTRAAAAMAAWTDGLARAIASLDDARRDALDAVAARGESLAKVDGCAAALCEPPAVADIDALRAELDALAARPVAPPTAVVEGLLARVDELRARTQAALDANRAPLVRRDELRGLLRAYEAKAGAAGRLEDAPIATLVRAAEDELHTTPADLGRAQASIDQLAAALRQPKGVR